MKMQQMGKRLAVVSAVMILSAVTAMTVWGKTRLETVSDVYWNDEDDNESKITEAVWEPVEDASQYEIYLYRDGSKVGEVTVKSSKNSYNFKRKMDKEGEYTFRVRALPKKNSSEYSNSAWSEYSDGLYITEARAEYNKSGKQEDTSKSGPGMPVGGETSPEGSGETTAETNNEVLAENSKKPVEENTSDEKVLAENSKKPVAGDGSNTSGADSQQQSQTSDSQPKTGAWVEDNTGWWYRWSDGSYPAGSWFQDPADGKYYMLDGQGYMRTGWIDWNEKRYYCDRAGVPSGAMVTGEHYIDGMLYRFDDSGAMIDESITSGGSSSRVDDED
ncbi:MAG: hypothetical protein HFG57_10295 [Lachnospiraceae bacterium]|nr:hypothetical protein [Lachnospiraceae bacterium]